MISKSVSKQHLIDLLEEYDGDMVFVSSDEDHVSIVVFDEDSNDKIASIDFTPDEVISYDM